MFTTLFPWLSLAGAAGVVLVAALTRGRPFAVFVGVLLAIQTLVASALCARFVWCWPAYASLQAALLLHFALLARPKLRPLAYRVLVSVPASWFLAGTVLGIPWAVVVAVGGTARGAWIPYAIALAGVVQSLWQRSEEVDIVLDGAAVDALRRQPHGSSRVGRPLRIIQITDPHLGAFMSEQRLHRICARAVAKAPDLVFLTGDFLTMESHGAPEALRRALAPLLSLRGRVFACLGNHDHEAPETVAYALAAIGAELLVDDAAEVETPAGPVQIVGMDFVWRQRKERMAAVCAKYPRRDGVLRIVLLHDPGAFHHLGAGEADLVLSGHTHGGQLGLLSFGLPGTVVSAFSAIPDHGLWARGTDRLYVHRGTGHYGFPLRLGVPSEESLLRLHWVGWQGVTAAH